MVNRDNLIKRIEVLPPHLIQEVIDVILYCIKKQNVLSIADITL